MLLSSLHKSGYEVVFCDVMDKLIETLQTTKSYKVIQVGVEGTTEDEITNYRAINSKTHEADVVKEISTADVVTCSVGPNILKFIAPVIAKGIDARTSDKPLAVIACENMIGATDTLAGFIKGDKNIDQGRLADHHTRASYANSAIDRIVPAQDPDAGLSVKLEKFYEWVVESTPFKNHEVPSIKGIKWVENLEPYIERKLYTVNTAHAAAAYHGYVNKKATVDEAMDDSKIAAEVRKCVKETAALIVKKHGIAASEQDEYVEKIIVRITNPHLKDGVERVGRAPLRKLGRKERFIGPAAQLAEQGMAVDGLVDAAESAFRFYTYTEDPEAVELAQKLKAGTPESIVTDVCGLESSHPLFAKIVERVQKVKSEMS